MLEYLRAEYEKVVAIPLTVRFVGRINPETLAPVVQSLFDLDLAAEPTGFRRVIDTQLGLRVHVTKSVRPDWFSVMDRVGWVQFNSQQIIAGAIEAKSKKLSQYQIAIGPDVRLLLVANRIQNSGKLRLSEERGFDLHGFKQVYLFPFPEDVIMLHQG